MVSYYSFTTPSGDTGDMKPDTLTCSSLPDLSTHFSSHFNPATIEWNPLGLELHSPAVNPWQWYWEGKANNGACSNNNLLVD